MIMDTTVEPTKHDTGTVKVSIQLPKASKLKYGKRLPPTSNQERQNHQLDWEIDAKGEIDHNGADDNNSHDPLVIPCLKNTFQLQKSATAYASSEKVEKEHPEKRMKDSSTENGEELDNDDLRAALALQAEASVDNSNPPRIGMSNHNVIAILPQSSTVSSGILNNGNNQEYNKTNSLVDSETQQYKTQLNKLPDELDFHDYKNRVPISDFGSALLRGMGWKEESDNANSQKEDDVRLPRPFRLGLGAIPRPQMLLDDTSKGNSRRKPLRPGQLEQQERLKIQQQEFEQQRQDRQLRDAQETLQIGSIVYVSKIEDNGKNNDTKQRKSSTDHKQRCRAKVVQLAGVPGLNRVKVQIEGDESPCVVRRSDINGLVARQDLRVKPFQHTKASKNVDRNDKVHSKNGHGEKNNASDVNLSKRQQSQKRDRSDKKSYESNFLSSKRPRQSDSVDSKKLPTNHWLVTNIRVRVITERWGRRYYKEKGVVVDVTSKGATLRMSTDGGVLDGISEQYLETALPKTGGNVIVLVGPHRMAKGQLLERNSKTSKGVVQFFDDMSVMTLSLDDVAEWCGPLDDDLE